MKRFLATILLILSTTSLFAQETKVEKFFEGSEKIYVVIATIAIVFIGLAIYLVMIDRRLKKIEKEN